MLCVEALITCEYVEGCLCRWGIEALPVLVASFLLLCWICFHPFKGGFAGVDDARTPPITCSIACGIYIGGNRCASLCTDADMSDGRSASGEQDELGADGLGQDGSSDEAAKEQARLEDIAWGRERRKWADKWMIGYWADIDHRKGAPPEDDLESRLPGRDGSTRVSHTVPDPDEGKYQLWGCGLWGG